MFIYRDYPYYNKARLGEDNVRNERMRSPTCCRGVASAGPHCPKVEGGGERRKRSGCKGRMGWNWLVVPCAGGRGRNGCEGMKRGGNEWKNVEDLSCYSKFEYVADRRFRVDMVIRSSSSSVAPKYDRGTSQRAYSKHVPQGEHRLSSCWWEGDLTRSRGKSRHMGGATHQARRLPKDI